MKEHWWSVEKIAELYRVVPSTVQQWVGRKRLDAELHNSTMLVSSRNLSDFIAGRNGMRREKLRDPNKNWLDLGDGA